MKKFIAGGLVLGMLLTLGTAAFASVDVSGNLQAWLKSDTQNGNRETYFAFERLALDVAGNVTENSGISSEVRLQKVGANKASGHIANAPDEDNVDFKLKYAYYYQKGIFTKNDQIDFGYVKSPFEAGNYLSWFGGLEGYLDAGNSVGLRYNWNNDVFAVNANVVNSDTDSSAYSSTANGVDFILRGTYTGVKDFAFGAAYRHHDTGTEIDEIAAVDVTYGHGPFGAYVECLNLDNGTDSDTGFFGEVNYKFTEKLSGYVDVTTNTDELYGFDGYTKDNLYVVGATYQLTEKASLQAEYESKADDSNVDFYGIHFQVNF